MDVCTMMHMLKNSKHSFVQLFTIYTNIYGIIVFEYDKDSLLTCIFAQQNLTCENERSLDIAYASLNVQNGHFWEKSMTFWFFWLFYLICDNLIWNLNE